MRSTPMRRSRFRGSAGLRGNTSMQRRKRPGLIDIHSALDENELAHWRELYAEEALEMAGFSGWIREEGRQAGWRESWREGWREGWLEGWREGRREGAHEALASLLLRLLTLRFNADVAEAMRARIETADVAQLRRWSERVVIATSPQDIFA